MAALQADADLQVLFVGQLVGLHQRAEAGGVDAAGLLHEDVLAGLRWPRRSGSAGSRAAWP